jgi:hypothetical protein
MFKVNVTWIPFTWLTSWMKNIFLRCPRPKIKLKVPTPLLMFLIQINNVLWSNEIIPCHNFTYIHTFPPYGFVFVVKNFGRVAQTQLSLNVIFQSLKFLKSIPWYVNRWFGLLIMPMCRFLICLSVCSMVKT